MIPQGYYINADGQMIEVEASGMGPDYRFLNPGPGVSTHRFGHRNRRQLAEDLKGFFLLAEIDLRPEYSRLRTSAMGFS